MKKTTNTKKKFTKKKMFTMFTALLLVAAQLMTLSGCSSKVQAKNLMEDVEPQKVEVVQDMTEDNVKVSEFAVRLMQESLEADKNTLISPLSVLYALSMTANGAKEETLAQMEAVLGMSVEELNQYLYSYMQNLMQSEKQALNLANSIWFTSEEHFTVNQDFLQKNADYYGADVYQAAFDGTTLEDINNWVKEKTKEMIPEILNEIDVDAVMYLVNALAFEAEWQDVYGERKVKEGEFTQEDGTKQNVDFMYSEENVYLEDEMATGFLKYYSGRDYAFVGLLPKEGISVQEYVESLSGEHIVELLENAQYTTVYTSLPKFETEYDVEMKNILKAMGMPDAFDAGKADFSDLGTSTAGNIYISRVIHKTYISVAEKGTKAGAATVVEMVAESASETIEEPEKVYLDRPFVYMLIDCENNIPFFIGTMMDVEG